MNDSQIIDALGGTKQVADLCRVRPASVSEWRRFGIPDARRQFLELLRPDIFSPATLEAKNARPDVFIESLAVDANADSAKAA